MRINKVEATGTSMSSVHRAFFFPLSATFSLRCQVRLIPTLFVGVCWDPQLILACVLLGTLSAKNTKCKKLFKNSEKS